MAPDYDHLTLMQKVEVFEHALEHTQGDDLARLLWLKSPSSEVWFDRRTNYTRSLAVMSMVGYILGLGDRYVLYNRYNASDPTISKKEEWNPRLKGAVTHSSCRLQLRTRQCLGGRDCTITDSGKLGLVSLNQLHTGVLLTAWSSLLLSSVLSTSPDTCI